MNQEYQQTVADRPEWELWADWLVFKDNGFKIEFKEFVAWKFSGNPIWKLNVYIQAQEDGYPHSFDEFCVDWDCMIDVAKTTKRSWKDGRNS